MRHAHTAVASNGFGWRGAPARATIASRMPDPVDPAVDPQPVPEAPEAPVRRVHASVRLPEAAVSRTIGPLTLADAGRHGAQIGCSTTFAARRAAVAELERSTPNPAVVHGPLGGPMPARMRAGPISTVAIHVVIDDVSTDRGDRPKPI